MDYEFLIMLIILIICYIVSLTYAICFFIFWIVVALFGFFCTSMGMDLAPENISQSELYYQTYQGNYQQLYPRLNEFKMIRKKFNLPEIYKPFGIFYDNPKENNLTKCRAVVGIIKEIQNKDVETKNIDVKGFKDYMKDNKFIFGILPTSKCLIGYYSSYFSIQHSFLFITKIFVKMINLKFFTRVYNPRWKDFNIKTARKNYNKKYGVLEVFDHRELRLYIPLENEQEFFLYD